MQFVDVEHPVVGRATVPQSRVKHLSEGWAAADAAVSLDELAEPFDPAGHTVDEVLAYLDQADDAERTRVLEAERSGKARVSILNG